MNLIPIPSNFHHDYLLLTEGKCPKNHFTRRIDFERSISLLTSEKEFVLVEFLCKFLYARTTQNITKKSFFKNDQHFISFFVGLIHYCPNFFLNQLEEPITKRRYHAVLLLRSTISLLVSLNYSLTSIFMLQTTNSDQYSFLIFKTFLKRYNDSEKSIRALYLQTAFLLLSCSKNFIDFQVRKEICLKICHLCQYDPQIEIREFCLTIIENIFHCKPGNAFFDETFDVLTNICFDHVTPFRIFAQQKLVKIYIDLMKHYPPEIFYLSRIGRICGALRVRFNQVKEKKEKQLLYNHLKEINNFLHSRKVNKFRNSSFNSKPSTAIV